mmetsp:Transcript_32555/g.95949  ORF Transcript_32555/g.95949 Transcript_32555/m.95949 type:complete len:208 (+) Transcript_32555:114-737(+)
MAGTARFRTCSTACGARRTATTRRRAARGTSARLLVDFDFRLLRLQPPPPAPAPPPLLLLAFPLFLRQPRPFHLQQSPSPKQLLLQRGRFQSDNAVRTSRVVLLHRRSRSTASVRLQQTTLQRRPRPRPRRARWSALELELAMPSPAGAGGDDDDDESGSESNRPILHARPARTQPIRWTERSSTGWRSRQRQFPSPPPPPSESTSR